MKISSPSELIIFGVFFMLLIVSNQGFALEQGPPPKFINIAKLTVIDEHTPEQDSFEVTDVTQIDWLVEKIQLRPARPCLCDHRWIVMFHSAKGDPIKVGLSDHSFEVKNEFGEAHFSMPAELYRRFHSLVKHYTGAL